jgi:hypothetical protein
MFVTAVADLGRRDPDGPSTVRMNQRPAAKLPNAIAIKIIDVVTGVRPFNDAVNA